MWFSYPTVAGCGSARLLARNRGSQAFAALGAAPFQDCASSRRGHPGKESVGSFAAAIVRLVGPFHRSGPTLYRARELARFKISSIEARRVAKACAPDPPCNHTSASRASTAEPLWRPSAPVVTDGSPAGAKRHRCPRTDRSDRHRQRGLFPVWRSSVATAPPVSSVVTAWCSTSRATTTGW